jgi:hypothetical protein
VEKSLLMLSRCVRALERLKTSKPPEMSLPLLLLSAARGDEREQISLGDGSRYYDALCKLHQEDLAQDLSYPQHAHYDHFQHEQIGESIIDSLADVEEIIAGARNIMLNPLNLSVDENANDAPERQTKAQFIEVNACLPNRPGALADYVASLAGIEFKSTPKTALEEIWRTANNSPGHPALLPSYQYLRHVALDSQGTAFVLTGYATLAPLAKETDPEAPLAVRVYANDGRNHREPKKDSDAEKFIIDRLLQSRLQQNFKPPAAPGVPEVIDRLMKRGHDGYNTVREFHQVMLDPQPNQSTGEHACPAMPVCRIAAFQDYVVASNNLRLQRAVMSEKNQDEELLHARNYYCCTGITPATKHEIPALDSPYARIFCCCRGTHGPGMIAMVLNTLLFRKLHKRFPAIEGSKDNWIINISYFKDSSCQNQNFTLNRLFGSFEKKPDKPESEKSLLFPVHLLRILPIGSMNSARQWYYYMRTLHQFLNPPDNLQYEFTWLDENREIHLDSEPPPTFDKHRPPSRPIALIIEKLEGKPDHAKEGCCDLCGLQSRENDCRKLRVWV